MADHVSPGSCPVDPDMIDNGKNEGLIEKILESANYHKRLTNKRISSTFIEAA
jgi:hypothetical protein